MEASLGEVDEEEDGGDEDDDVRNDTFGGDDCEETDAVPWCDDESLEGRGTARLSAFCFLCNIKAADRFSTDDIYVC